MSLIRIGEIKIKPTKMNNTGNPYYSFSGSLDTNIYEDITSNQNWMEIGINRYDYLFCRNQVMTWTAINGFSGMSQTEKEIASANFAVGKSNRDTVHAESEQASNWQGFIERSQDAREQRWRAAKAYISYVLTPPQGLDVAISTNLLSTEYITYGIEDYASDGVAGLLDWLGNTNVYSGGTGFSGKEYWIQEYTDNMLNILKNGNY